jgi:hypothetical protein
MPAAIAAYATMQHKTHALKMTRLTGVGQAYMGGREEHIVKTSGTRANVGRCMLLPPPTLTHGQAPAIYVTKERLGLRSDIMFFIFRLSLSYQKIVNLCVNLA